MTQTADGEQQNEMAKEPAAAPTAGAERRWLFARVLSLLLMVAGLLLPWSVTLVFGFQMVMYFFELASYIIVPYLLVFMLGVALLLPVHIPPKAHRVLSWVYVMALALAGLLSTWMFMLLGSGWAEADSKTLGGIVFPIGVVLALIVEARSLNRLNRHT